MGYNNILNVTVVKSRKKKVGKYLVMLAPEDTKVNNVYLILTSIVAKETFKNYDGYFGALHFFKSVNLNNLEKKFKGFKRNMKLEARV